MSRTKRWSANRRARRSGVSDVETSGSLRIAVVEDNRDLREHVYVAGLADYGFEAVGLGSAAELYRQMMVEPFDIVVLDVGLPDESGFEVARHLRATTSAGIVILTARSDMSDRVRGLSSGADAYLSKPVEVELLVATLTSLARRLATDRRSSASPEPSWRITSEGWQLVAPGECVVELSHAERCILGRLAQAAGEVVSRESLISCLTDDAHNFDPHRLEMVVYRLRRKVMAETGQKLPLRAVRGQGYVLAIASAAMEVVQVGADGTAVG